MADTAAVPASTLDPAYVTALNDAIEKTWAAGHEATGGSVAMMFTVSAELMAHTLACLYSAGEHVELQPIMGHLFSRAQQIMASVDGPLTRRRDAN